MSNFEDLYVLVKKDDHSSSVNKTVYTYYNAELALMDTTYEGKCDIITLAQYIINVYNDGCQNG